MIEQRWQEAATARNVAVLRHAVRAFARDNAVPEPPLRDLTLALNEAMTNAVLHAYRASAAGTITVLAAVEPGCSMKVHVLDDGEGMHARTDSPGLGVGLALICSVATSSTITTPRTGHGTDVCMVFDYAPAA